MTDHNKMNLTQHIYKWLKLIFHGSINSNKQSHEPNYSLMNFEMDWLFYEKYDYFIVKNEMIRSIYLLNVDKDSLFNICMKKKIINCTNLSIKWTIWFYHSTEWVTRDNADTSFNCWTTRILEASRINNNSYLISTDDGVFCKIPF